MMWYDIRKCVPGTKKREILCLFNNGTCRIMFSTDKFPGDYKCGVRDVHVTHWADIDLPEDASKEHSALYGC